jgi:hypothetical protein
MFNNALNAPNLEGIIFPGKPRQYRSDCQSGQFKIGASKLLGKSLTMEILAWRIFEDELFGYEHQPWLEIIFIDASNVVSHILFKTESLDNFANLALDKAQDGVGVGEGITTATMSKRSSARNGTSYFAVEFDWQPNKPERLLEIAEFAQTLQLEKLSVGSLTPALPD